MHFLQLLHKQDKNILHYLYVRIVHQNEEKIILCKNLNYTQNNIIDYSILNYDAPIFPQSTENVLIKINIDNNIDNNNIIKIMYTIDSHISGMNNLDEIYKNTDNSIIELYNNRYFKC